MADDFARLQAQWYGRLARQGFDDIEAPDGSLRPSVDLSTGRAQDIWAVQEFYREAQELYHRPGVFKTRRHRAIWRHFADGEPLRKIGRRFGLSHTQIRRICARYKPLISQHLGSRPGRGDADPAPAAVSAPHPVPGPKSPTGPPDADRSHHG